MKRYSIAYAIRTLQTKTMRYHTTPIEWLKSKVLTIPDTDEDVEQQGLPFTAGGNAKWLSHFGRQIWQFLIKRNLLLACDPGIKLLGIYQMSWKLKSTQKSACKCLQQPYSPFFLPVQVLFIYDHLFKPYYLQQSYLWNEWLL